MHVKVKLSEILSCSQKHRVTKLKATEKNAEGCLLLFLSVGHDLISLGTVDITLSSLFALKQRVDLHFQPF